MLLSWLFMIVDNIITYVMARAKLSGPPTPPSGDSTLAFCCYSWGVLTLTLMRQIAVKQKHAFVYAHVWTEAHCEMFHVSPRQYPWIKWFRVVYLFCRYWNSSERSHVLLLMYLSVRLPARLRLPAPACLSVCLSVCRSVCRSVRLPACPSACLSDRLFVFIMYLAYWPTMLDRSSSYVVE